MLFNSYIFILLFLPICLFGYYVINSLKFYKTGMFFLLGMSLWFYGYFNPYYLLIIIASVLGNYMFYKAMNKVKTRRDRRLLLILAIILNVGVLIYYKYMDFFIVNINTLFGTDWPLLHIVLPLGISFFTFQQISFIVDAYRDELKYSLLEYACFVCFFPQLIAGPIVTHDELIPQLINPDKKRLDWENMSKGIYIFVLGLSKKILIADVFGNAVAVGYAGLDNLDSTNAILTMLAYTIQIYFDFSGYCDMAIGIGKMLNIELPVNFNSPYKALTITEFWDRWHITLTRFLTKYIYIPLGGNRKGQIRTYINTMIVFLISGFWHGANWTFILWGGCHGLFVIITKKFKRAFDNLHPALNWMVTFLFVNVMWVFFRADSIGDAVKLLNRILMCNFGPINIEFANCFRLKEIIFFTSKFVTFEMTYTYYMLVAYYVVAILLCLGARNAYERTNSMSPSIRRSVFIGFMAVWCIFSLGGVSTFLYFNF